MLTSQEIAKEVLKFMKIAGNKKGICEEKIEHLVYPSLTSTQNENLNSYLSPQRIADFAISCIDSPKEDLQDTIKSAIGSISNNSISLHELDGTVHTIEKAFTTLNEQEEYIQEPSEVIHQCLENLLKQFNVSVYDEQTLMLSEEDEAAIQEETEEFLDLDSEGRLTKDFM